MGGRGWERGGRYLDGEIKAVEHLEVFEDARLAGGADDEQPVVAFVGDPLDEHEERLEDGVGEARADVDVLDDALDVVDDDARPGRLVGVVENPLDLVDDGALGVADEELGADELDVGEAAVHGGPSCDARLPGADFALEQNRVDLGVPARVGLVDGVLEDGLDALEVRAVVDQLVLQEQVELRGVDAELRLDWGVKDRGSRGAAANLPRAPSGSPPW